MDGCSCDCRLGFAFRIFIEDEVLPDVVITYITFISHGECTVCVSNRVDPRCRHVRKGLLDELLCGSDEYTVVSVYSPLTGTPEHPNNGTDDKLLAGANSKTPWRRSTGTSKATLTATVAHRIRTTPPRHWPTPHPCAPSPSHRWRTS